MNTVRRLTGIIGPGLWLLGLLAALMVLLWALGSHVTEALQYRRSSIVAGEWWRLVTGHFVHAGFRHMALNVAGGLVMAALFARTYSRNQWLAILAVSLIAIDIGFWVRDRNLETYVGFSGVLHGALAAGTIAWWRTERLALAIAITCVTVGKLAWEQWEGPVSMVGDGLTIIVNAHLYGAMGGGAVGAILFALGKIPNASDLERSDRARRL